MDELSWKIMLSLKQLNMKTFIVMAQEPIKYLSTLFTAAGSESSIGEIHICTLNICLCKYIHAYIYICMHIMTSELINPEAFLSYVESCMNIYVHTCKNTYIRIFTRLYTLP
jgi:hypothetical protein